MTQAEFDPDAQVERVVANARRVTDFQSAVIQRSPGRTEQTTLAQAWAATPMSDLVRLMVEYGVTPVMLLEQIEVEEAVRPMREEETPVTPELREEK